MIPGLMELLNHLSGDLALWRLESCRRPCCAELGYMEQEEEGIACRD